MSSTSKQKQVVGYTISLVVYAVLYIAATQYGHAAAHWLLAIAVGTIAVISMIAVSTAEARSASKAEEFVPIWLAWPIALVHIGFAIAAGWWITAGWRLITVLAAQKIHNTPELDLLKAINRNVEHETINMEGIEPEDQARAAALLEGLKIKSEGYAGMMKDGRLVDRREFPEAIPIPKNSLLGVPEPKPVDGDDFR